MPNSVSITFPKEISNTLFGLRERNFLTPTFLSALVMIPVFPKQFEKFIKPQVYYPLAQENLKEMLFQRAKKGWFILGVQATESEMREIFNEYFTTISATHQFHVTSENGVERLELRAKEESAQYVIYYPANAQDAMHIMGIDAQVKLFANKNHIFWNYIGTESKDELSLSVYDLIDLGVKQVQNLVDKNVPMQNITLSGRSLGGGIACQVMKRCKGHERLPNLHVDRSFASIYAVAVSIADKINAHVPEEWKPMIAGLLSFALLGFSSGLIVSGIIATAGVLASTVLAAISFGLAHGIQSLKKITNLLPIAEKAERVLNQFTVFVNEHASYLWIWLQNQCFNVLAATIGGVIGLVGLVVGGVLGLLIGGLFALPFLSKYGPLLDSLLYKVLKLITRVAHIELDSAAALHDVLTHREQPPTVVSINTKDDEVIPPSAALNTGLQFESEQSEYDSSFPLLNKVSFFWYASGGHNDTPKDLYRSLECGG